MSEKRLLLLLVTPPLLAASLVYLATTYEFTRLLDGQQRFHGEAIADQTAELVTQYVVDGDMLSLNVMIRRLADNEQIEFAAIYDDDNQLILQAGREHKGQMSFTKELTFQDSTVGRIRLTVRPVVAASFWRLPLAAFTLFAYALVVLRYAPQIRGWLAEAPLEREARKEREDEPAASFPLQPEPSPAAACMLTTRIRPAHYLEMHFDKFYQAADLHLGIVEQTTPEELVIHFEGIDAIFRAACTGLLIRQVAGMVAGNIGFGGILSIVTARDNPDEARKAASYLASIADGDLLVVGGASLPDERLGMQPFHHALVDSQGLMKLSGLRGHDTLGEQARQLAKA